MFLHNKKELNNMSSPKVGVGIFVVKNNRILLGKRKNSHGSGKWSLPGGHVEYAEDYFDTCYRELSEETGCTSESFDKVGFSQDFFGKDKHYITLYFVTSGNHFPENVENMEPEKCEGWQWFKKEDLPPDNELFCKTSEFIHLPWIWNYLT